MKRAFPILALLLVLAAVVFFTMRRAGGVAGGFPASRSAELVSAETLFYAEVTDWERTLGRWKTSELGTLAGEPEAREFLEEWLKNATKPEETGLLLRVFPELKKIAPAGGFIAFTGFVNEPLPKMILGIPYRAKKGDVEGAVRVMKDELFKSWPGAKSELSQHSGIEIESITSATATEGISISIPLRPPPGSPRSASSYRRFPSKPPMMRLGPQPHPAVHLAFRDDWLFFSTDRALLQGTLDRYLRQPGATQSLAAVPAFMEGRKQEVPEPDFVAWVPWEAAGPELATMLLPRNVPALPKALGMHKGAQIVVQPRETSDPGKQSEAQRTLHYSWRLDGPVRDRTYFHLGQAPEVPALASKALALTTPDTPGFISVNFDALREQRGWVQTELSLSQYWGKVGALLYRKPPELGDPWEAFGPEAAAIFLKVEASESPQHVVALEVRDAAKARKFAEAIVRGEESLTVAMEGDTTRWDWVIRDGRAPENSYRPAMALTKTHLLFGSASGGIAEIVRRSAQSGPGGPTLAANPAFAEAVRDRPALTGAFFYLATERFVPTSRLSVPTVSGEPPLTNTLRVAIAKHVRPGTIRVQPAGSGWLVESSLDAIGNSVLVQLLEAGRGLE